MMPAQNLPSLPVEECITRGTLPCGVAYYLVKNGTDKGYADFALVRRGEFPSEETRSQLSGIEGFCGRAGIAIREDGLLREFEGSTVYRLDGVPVYDREVLDSTLLLSFNLMKESRSPQCFVISGDIDPAAVKNRMEIFSMMVPKIYGRGTSSDYVWEPSVAPSIQIRKPEADGLSGVGITFSAARTPRRYMNTAQNLVMDIFAREFSTVLEQRLRRNLASRGIPYYDISVSYLGSSETGGDEKYSAFVGTSAYRTDEVLSALASSLATIGSFGALLGEFNDAKTLLGADMKRLASSPQGNGPYVDRCISSYLFGGSLAPFKEEEKFFSGKMVADTTDLRFFNDISRGILGDHRNAEVVYASPADSLDDNQILFDFNLASLLGSVAGDNSEYIYMKNDTLVLQNRFPKVRVSSERTEPVSGGTVWSFSNGTNVIFRQVDGGGMFHYAVSLGTGLSSIPDLKEGEGGYVGDLLDLYDVRGLDAWKFRNMLRVNGIEMKTTVELRNTVIRGSAPMNRLDLLMKSLATLSAFGKLNRDEYGYYLACERLRDLAADETDARMASALWPEFNYSSRKDASSISGALPDKVEKFYSECFRDFSNGVFVFAGDFDPVRLKKLLCRYMGGFSAVRTTSRRTSVQSRPIAGGKTVTLEGSRPGVRVVMTSEVPLTTANYYAAPMALRHLERQLASILSPSGVSVRVSHGFSSYPQERLTAWIECSAVPRESMPPGVARPDMEEVLSLVREGIGNSVSNKVSKADLAAYQQNVTASANAVQNTPEALVDAVLFRYSMGKDFVTGRDSQIKSINDSRIRDILSALAGGGRVEAIVR